MRSATWPADARDKLVHPLASVNHPTVPVHEVNPCWRSSRSAAPPPRATDTPGEKLSEMIRLLLTSHQVRRRRSPPSVLAFRRPRSAIVSIINSEDTIAAPTPHYGPSPAFLARRPSADGYGARHRRDRQAVGSSQRLRRAAQALDRRTHLRMAWPLPKDWECFDNTALAFSAPRLHPRHAGKTMQSRIMFWDILL